MRIVGAALPIPSSALPVAWAGQTTVRGLAAAVSLGLALSVLPACRDGEELQLPASRRVSSSEGVDVLASGRLDSAEERGEPPVGAFTDGTVVLARMQGQEVTADEFVRFVTKVRGDGYRPATSAEASRLLRGLLREAVLANLVQSRGLTDDPQGRQKVLATLVERRPAPDPLDPGRPSSERAESVRYEAEQRLLEHGAAEVLASLVERAPPEVDALTTWARDGVGELA